MALFRRFFYRKPPDHLLEISDRIYVFDSCFSTDVLEEDEYKVYMGGIVAQLQDYHPDASFLVFNFQEGDKRSQISDLLQKYDMTVMEYPWQYEGCPLLPLEMIHHFLLSSESWLSLAGQQNVLLMHCERGGWPVLAFMLAGLLLFRKQYHGEQKTLEMVYMQAPRELLHLLSPLNPQPSQLRYLQYISRRNLGSDWPPSDIPLALTCIFLRVLPLFGRKGCRPVVRIYGQDPASTANRSPKLLFSSSKTKRYPRYYRQEECALVKIDIQQRVQGDVVLECVNLDDDHIREEMIFRVMFHTAFVRHNILMLGCDEVDVLWDVRDHMPKEFRAEVVLDADALPSIITTEEVSEDGNKNESASPERVSKVEEVFGKVDWLDAKGENHDIVLKEEPDPHAVEDCASDAGNQKHDVKVVPIMKEFEHLRIRLEDVKSATNNFSSSNYIGRGGFGKVYKGELSHVKEQTSIAVKRLDRAFGQGNPEFWKEVMMLSHYRHKNIICLLGFCDESDEKILVYEHACQGSLDYYLSSTDLTWTQRLRICIGAARGLEFLHNPQGTQQRVLHRDIKSSNILLDEKWNAKISDFGLSKLGPANQQFTYLVSNVAGTFGYCDPLYMETGFLTKESDVYSFGVVLFEVLCGRLCIGNYEDRRPLTAVVRQSYEQNTLQEIVFDNMKYQMKPDSLKAFTTIAYRCLKRDRKERPTMAEILKQLELALESQERNQ